MAQYWVGRGGVKLGPFDRDRALADYASGAIGPDEPVWTEGMADWKPASEVLARAASPPLTLEPLAPKAAAAPYRPPSAKVVSDAGEGPGEYAGFWVRYAAFTLDQLILGAVAVIAGLVLGVARAGLKGAGFGNESAMQALIVIGVVIGFGLYYTLMESGPHGATWGKRAFKLQVLRADTFERISFMRAAGRFFGRMLSYVILYIGYLMQPFTAKKQALHDMMSDTVVVRRGHTSGWLVALAVLPSLVLPLIGIVAAVSLPAYQDYTVRAKVAGALAATEPAKAAVARFVTRNRRSPVSLADAGYAHRAGADGIRSIALDSRNAVLTVELDFPPLAGKTLLLVPEITASDRMTWACRGGTVPPTYLPPTCREPA